MVTRKEIRVSIDAQGNVHLEPVGAQGPQCLEWTKEIEDALGIPVSREMKSEFYVSDSEVENASTFE